MKHEKGKTDQFQIHIGGGAFDAGTSEAREYSDSIIYSRLTFV